MDAFAAVVPQRRSMLTRARRHRGLMIGAGLLAALVLLAFVGPLIWEHSPYAQDLVHRRTPPVWYGWMYHDVHATWAHPLGTDNLGRDYLSRLLYGTRLSLIIGALAMLCSGLIGTALGMIAGYYGGRIDMVVNFLITTRLSIPIVLVALAVVSLYGGSIQIMILVLGLLLWDRFAVVLRSVTLQARRLDYVTAARALGCSTPFIIIREILPNVMGQLIVVATVEMALAILLEAALSFLGLGVRPPNPSLGLMLAEAKNEMFFAAWMITIPGIALFLIVLSINLLGDGVRDLAAIDRTP